MKQVIIYSGKCPYCWTYYDADTRKEARESAFKCCQHKRKTYGAKPVEVGTRTAHKRVNKNSGSR